MFLEKAHIPQLAGILLVVLFLLSPAACTRVDKAELPRNAAQIGPLSPTPLEVTINPEARVSVVLAGQLPSRAKCGTAIDVPVSIVNQGFVTARLEARLIEKVPGIALHLQASPLRGVTKETRVLRIILNKPDLTDITVAFTLPNEVPNPDGSDSVHFLVSCSA